MSDGATGEFASVGAEAASALCHRPMAAPEGSLIAPETLASRERAVLRQRIFDEVDVEMEAGAIERQVVVAGASQLPMATHHMDHWPDLVDPATGPDAGLADGDAANRIGHRGLPTAF